MTGPAKKYDIFLIDADDTILDFAKCEHDALKAVLDGFGLESSEEVISIYSRINNLCWKRLERCELTKEKLKTERFRMFRNCMEFPVTGEALADGYLNTLPDFCYMLPGSLDAMKRIRRHGKLYIITNGLYETQKKRLRESGIDDNCDGVFISEKVGAEKPSRAFFDAVAEKTGVLDPERTLVIGDSLSSDISGGVNYGLDTLWINRGKAAPSGAAFTYTLESFAEVPDFLGLE